MKPLLLLSAGILFIMSACNINPNNSDNSQSKNKKSHGQHRNESSLNEYNSTYFGYSFKSPSIYDYCISPSDSICEYTTIENEESIDVYIWSESDFDYDFNTVEEYAEFFIGNSGASYEVLNLPNSNDNTVLYVIYDEEIETDNRDESFEFYYLVAWNKSQELLMEVDFICSSENKELYLEIAESFDPTYQ